MCKRGARILDPWDTDTYISRHSFEICVLAQAAWMDGVDAGEFFAPGLIVTVLSICTYLNIITVLRDNEMAFAVTRPPGHHAVKTRYLNPSTSQNYLIDNGIKSKTRTRKK